MQLTGRAHRDVFYRTIFVVGSGDDVIAHIGTRLLFLLDEMPVCLGQDDRFAALLVFLPIGNLVSQGLSSQKMTMS